MLVSLNEILNYAKANKKAVGSFNTPNLESILAVIAAAEELGEPVILMHAQVHEEIMPLSIIGPVMLERARSAKVPVCVHLDHGETLDYINEALELGFTSVMYDGSALDYGENVTNTKAAVAMARLKGASVEAEIGTLGKRELGSESKGDEVSEAAVYTNPEDAKRFVEATGIDALACSFGTAHGLYLKKPKLDMEVLDRIKAIIDIPLVLHGGSGVSEEDYRTVIQKGVCKINYYTYMAKAGGEEINNRLQGKQTSAVYFHEIAAWGCAAMKENVKQAISVFVNQ